MEYSSSCNKKWYVITTHKQIQNTVPYKLVNYDTIFWLMLNYIIYLKCKKKTQKTNFKKHRTLILLLLLMFLLWYPKKKKKKSLPSPISWNFSPIFNSKCFAISGLTLKYLIHFECRVGCKLLVLFFFMQISSFLNIICWVPDQGSNPGLLLYSQILHQLSHHGSPSLLTRLFFLHCIFF